ITDKPVAKGIRCQAEHIALRSPLRLLVVRNDDAVLRPRESIQSGRTPALAQHVALDCPFPVPSACDFDDSSPGIPQDVDTGRGCLILSWGPSIRREASRIIRPRSARARASAAATELV